MPLRAPLFGVRDSAAGPRRARPIALPTAQYAGVLTSIDEIDRAATGRGLISVVPEGAIIRRIPLVANVDGTLAPALAIEMIRVALGAPPLRLRVSAGRVDRHRGRRVFRAHRGRWRRARLLLAAQHGSLRLRDRHPGGSLRSGAAAAEAGADRRHRRRDPRGQEHAAGRHDAGGRDSRAAHGEPVRRDAAHPPVMGAARSRRWCSCCWARCSSSRRRGGGRSTRRCWRSAASPRCWRPVTSPFAAQRLLFDAATPAMGLGLLFGMLLRADPRGGEPAEEVARASRAGAARGERPHRRASSTRRRRIQTATLPRTDFLRDDPRIDLAATMIPAREVGGDLYDFFRLDERRLFFLVGDVAGKGLSASIFMAVSKALYKSTMLRAPAADIGDVMTVANAEVSRDNPEMLFVTAFAGILDLESGELAYCNAGHDNPYLTHPDRRGGSPHRGRRRAAAVRGRRFRLSRRTPPDARRRAALRRHRRRHRGAAIRPARCTAAERAAGHACPPRAAPAAMRTRSSTRCAPTWNHLSPAPSRRTTSRCWCCAGTGREAPLDPSPLRQRGGARQRLRG